MNLHKQGLTLFQLSFTQKKTTVVLSILIGLNLVSALLIMLMVACSGIVLVLDEGGQMARGEGRGPLWLPDEYLGHITTSNH